MYKNKLYNFATLCKERNIVKIGKNVYKLSLYEDNSKSSENF